jgi:hypothetical protein
MLGKLASASATRTCSRAVFGVQPTRQDNHCAQDRKSLVQPTAALVEQSQVGQHAVERGVDVSDVLGDLIGQQVESRSRHASM